MPYPSLIQLIESCLFTGSQKSWTDLVARLQPVIVTAAIRTFYRYAKQRPAGEVIDDLSQQVFINLCADDYKVLRLLRTQAEGKVVAYIRTMGAHQAIDYLRANTRVFEELDPAFPALDVDFDGNIELTQLVDHHLSACAGADAERSRTIFWLYYRTGLTSREIAGITRFGLKQKGVETLVSRLRQCIRKAIGEGFYGPSPLH